MTAVSTAGEARASRCDLGCPPRNRMANGQHSDAAKRAADNINLAIAAGGTDSIGKWMAIALADGATDHVLYPGKTDAALHQEHEQLFAYFKIPRQWVTLCEAESFLRVNRLYYDAGMRLTDPREVIKPLTKTAHASQLEDLRSALGIQDWSRYRR